MSTPPPVALPVGPVVDTTPAPAPGDVTLEGRFASLAKLGRPHGDSLWSALKDDDATWAYLGYGPFADRAAFDQWLAARVAASDPFAYAVIDRASGRALGSVTLMEIRPAMRVVEMGNIVLSPALQRTPASTEAQYLAARYVFEELGYRRYEWKCNALNAPSVRAARRLGFTYEGTFRQHMIVKGRSRDTAWFSIIDSEWPAVRAAFEAWLAPANFDSAGRQIASLTDIREQQREKK
jgi:RimJ/RimL family protein N-acetyltransferase